jgi:hypothetical protein
VKRCHFDDSPEGNFSVSCESVVNSSANRFIAFARLSETREFI